MQYDAIRNRFILCITMLRCWAIKNAWKFKYPSLSIITFANAFSFAIGEDKVIM